MGHIIMTSRMPQSLYQCLIFGLSTPSQVSNLRATISKAMEGFGLQPNTHFTITEGFEDSFVEMAPSVALFFGGENPSLPEHLELMRLSIPIIPLVSDVANVVNELPECLRSLNALALAPEDIELIKPAGVALQCLGLLPTQRRVFVSYRRTESRDVAVQLFEALSARQFEVFLDTHSVGAAVDFQSVLWHRLCDCDVVVMLDTPGFFDSRWARAEWGRATDKHISILQVLWPGHTASRTSALA
ncbi:TPA: toll/interleukin-1 receptor domain-containing protein, partial [Providencia rettgeri]|nr:toll/interleukin-1 receptor domain-containing protein [Providencia rettgeri]